MLRIINSTVSRWSGSGWHYPVVLHPWERVTALKYVAPAGISLIITGMSANDEPHVFHWSRWVCSCMACICEAYDRQSASQDAQLWCAYFEAYNQNSWEATPISAYLYHFVATDW